MLKTRRENDEVRLLGVIQSHQVIGEISDVIPEESVTVAQKAGGKIFILKDVGAHWLWVSLFSSDLEEEEINSELGYVDAVLGMRNYLEEDGESDHEVYVFESQIEMFEYFMKGER